MVFPMPMGWQHKDEEPHVEHREQRHDDSRHRHYQGLNDNGLNGLNGLYNICIASVDTSRQHYPPHGTELGEG